MQTDWPINKGRSLQMEYEYNEVNNYFAHTYNTFGSSTRRAWMTVKEELGLMFSGLLLKARGPDAPCWREIGLKDVNKEQEGDGEVVECEYFVTGWKLEVEFAKERGGASMRGWLRQNTLKHEYTHTDTHLHTYETPTCRQCVCVHKCFDVFCLNLPLQALFPSQTSIRGKYVIFNV